MTFTFQNTTRIHFGVGQIKMLSESIPADAKVLVVFGGGSIKLNGVYDQVTEALTKHTWGETGGIEPNPQYDTLMKIVDIVRAEGFDFILAVGGGSVIDGCKFIAAAAKYIGEDPWDMLTKFKAVEAAVPMACVLTLPATGSETNTGAVIARDTDKLIFGSPLVRPIFAVLDPAVTLSLSERQVANGVADAFVHVMEQYLTYPVNAKVQDRFAEGLLLTLLEEGPKALRDPDDLEVRSNIMWAATLALNGLLGAGVPSDWSTHMIGHELTGLYGVDHARSLTIVLPAMMKMRRTEKRSKLLQYAERVLGLTTGDEDQSIDAAIEATVQFFESLGLPTSLEDIELGDEAVDAVIAKLELHGRQGLSEQGDMGLVECRQVLEMAL